MTSQDQFASYEHAGVRTAVELVNALVIDRAYGREGATPNPLPILSAHFAEDATWPPVQPGDLEALTAVAHRLRTVIELLVKEDIDAAAAAINDLLSEHPAHPHLSKDDGRWRLHHHPATASLIPMVTAITAEAMGRLISIDENFRLGICLADVCDRVFFDVSKNGSRRFCSASCQNRAKTAAFRRRKSEGAPPVG